MAIVPSIFGKYAESQNLQAIIDNSQEVLYGAAFWRRYFDWGLPQNTLTFEGVKGVTRLVSAASIVEPDAPAPLRGRDGGSSYSGKIPTMKEKFSLNQKDYRALKQLEAMPISDEAKKNALLKLLYDDVLNCSKSGDARLDIFALEMMSTLKVVVNVSNNPDGAVYAEVDFLSRAEQRRGVPVVWSNTTADIFADIEQVVEDGRKQGIGFSRILVDAALWSKIKKNDNVATALKAFYNPGSNAKYLFTIDTVNEYLMANRLPVLEIVDEIKNVEKDGKPTTLRPFKAENAVFIPDGKLGIIHNAVAIEEWEPVQGLSYAKYDRTLVSKWRDNDPWREYTSMELNAFPDLERSDNIYIIQTEVVQA